MIDVALIVLSFILSFILGFFVAEFIYIKIDALLSGFKTKNLEKTVNQSFNDILDDFDFVFLKIEPLNKQYCFIHEQELLKQTIINAENKICEEIKNR